MIDILLSHLDYMYPLGAVVLTIGYYIWKNFRIHIKLEIKLMLDKTIGKGKQ